MAAKTQNAPTTVVGEFLKVAASRTITIQGTVPTGATGGGSSNVTFQDVIPTVPAILTEIEYHINMSVTLTLPANSSATVSPFAPYSAWANQITLGGAPPWPLTELTPWYLDDLTNHIDYDQAFPGIGNNASPAGANVDMGNSSLPGYENFGTVPGTTHSTSSSGASFTDNFNFRVRIKLQRKRGLLYGGIPMGDPENKIRNVTQLLPLIGTNPEQCLYVNVSSGATAALASAATVNCIYHVKYIDLLPSSDTQVPLPAIGYGLQLNANSLSIQNAGQQNKYYHRDSMAYLKLLSLLVNGQLPIQAYYWGLWDTQEQKSARNEYDTAQNTFQVYFSDFHHVYRRYPPKGFYLWDFVSGDFPEVTGVTPYNAIMSPDANYAEAFDVPVTPAMTTTITVPPGTTMNGAYQRMYSLGLVGVAY